MKENTACKNATAAIPMDQATPVFLFIKDFQMK
jgi:hypothetical protein